MGSLKQEASAAKGPRFERILVGVDFSPESEKAVMHAAQLARQKGARLILAHVVALPADVVEDSSYDPIFRAQVASAELGVMHRSQAGDLLQEIASRCEALGVQSESLLVDDNASDGLARIAEDMAADLLVVGTHGRTGLKRFLLGSVAERAVRLAEVHSLVARGDLADGRGYQRILVASDFSPASRSALAMALAIAPAGAAVEVVHCWQTPVAPTGIEAEPMRGELERAVAQSGERLLAQMDPDDRPRLRFASIESSAAEGIRRRAEEEGCDLIVTGSHGRRGVRRWLLGSVTETIIRHAPCSVLVVRPSAGQSAA
ncbi:MAG TPA: universal stress protein [Kofleriaceae bacterium]|nr:universal stress protein [Kofleriaceae bacterium]